MPIRTIALVLVSNVAFAAQYTAMERMPVKGGELRLASPMTGPDRRQEISLPLKQTRVDIDVAGPMAQVRLEQLFENPYSEPIEAVYVFPLGDEAAVHDYEIVIGERTIRGQIDTRENARRKYERARVNGNTAALLEEHKANVFQQSVANIPAHQTVRVKMSIAELVAHRDGAYELVFPMVVGPRYLPATTADPRAVGAHRAGGAPSARVSVPYLAPGMRSGHEVSLHARIDAGLPIQQVASPSHQITQKRIDDTTVEIDLAAGDTIPNRDFVLRYSGAGDSTLVGLLTDRRGSDGYFTLVLQPKASYRTGDIAAREMVIVIDRSGSMSGVPLQQAKALAHTLLGTLGDGDSFNLVAFADGVESLARNPVRADDAGKARGRAWIDALSCGGGTELGQGVAAGLMHPPGQDRIRLVYVLSDGYVGNDDEIIGAVEKTVGFNRIFTVGVGSAVNRYLMNRLAQVGRGFASYLLPADAPDALGAELARRTAHPYLTDVRVDWGGLDVKEVTPALIPDVYAGMPIVVSGRYGKAGEGEIAVSATVAGQRTTTRLHARLAERDDHPPVSYLWARRRIAELSAQEKQEKKITELGLSFHLVTAFTSFVAVDEQRVAGADGTPRLITQPVEMPQGVGYDGVFGDEEPAAQVSASRGGGGGGFGGAIDPFTLLTIGASLPILHALRKRRRERR